MINNDDNIHKIKENSNIIEKLLEENEKIICSMGYHVPDKNFVIDKENRIKIPRIYIRKKEKFIANYQLDKLCVDSKIRDNIAYCLQYTDLLNYLANRFDIWGSLEPIFYYNSIISIVSIIEAMMFECVARIRNKCKRCKIAVCSDRISKNVASGIISLVERLCMLKILDLDEIEKNDLIDLIHVRDDVHIRLMKTRAYFSEDYSIDRYNRAISLMKKINKDLLTNGPEFYICRREHK